MSDFMAKYDGARAELLKEMSDGPWGVDRPDTAPPHDWASRVAAALAERDLAYSVLGGGHVTYDGWFAVEVMLSSLSDDQRALVERLTNEQ